ncbi:carbon monoxide dehydrogenase [Polynucleobacter sp. SHI8]|uniref:(2Fe-2S)-binding protein n=1 Tax=unclassified Polynucleobacter TaxID=2640945 RepID=UPI00248FCC67|nr:MULTISPECIES: (2Fe-2S)-binding protein [unclassified Polynucleobacter]BDW11799.1 carbon monoxide dehydrogenase [Polynucleobacter sp. SHI2]BDW14246.1 carbon monoxide dehydrogenase [Polynucleobacter sp. SHI8]
MQITVNGQTQDLSIKDNTLLIDVIRDQLQLTGTHSGCDTTQCGCCTVLMDQVAVKSCTILARQAEGASIQTIEGLAKDHLHPVQEAFSEEHGLQCGYCTPGMIMSTVYLLQSHPNPTDEQIKEGLAGNICRCTGYVNIVKAVKSAAKKMQETHV